MPNPLTSIQHLSALSSAELHNHKQLAQKLGIHYDDFLDNVPNDERAAGIHASELNGCKRQVVYSLFNTERRAKVEKKWRKRFDVGTALHGMMQHHFKQMIERSNGFMTFEEEVKVNHTPLGKELFLTSSCDGVFTFFESNEPVLRVGLEIKSIAPDDYDGLKAPQPKHVDQAHLYMACLDLPMMWFLYWNKGTQQYTPPVAPFLMTYQPDIWEKLRGRAIECLEYADRGELPEREEGLPCTWCPYAYTCKPSFQARKEFAMAKQPIAIRRHRG